MMMGVGLKRGSYVDMSDDRVCDNLGNEHGIPFWRNVKEIDYTIWKTSLLRVTSVAFDEEAMAYSTPQAELHG